MVTDPFYELTALHLGAFAGDRRLLGDFSAGYGWQVDADFAEHALQVTLMHRFDCFGSVNHLAKDARSLADLAREVWTPIACLSASFSPAPGQGSLLTRERITATMNNGCSQRSD